MNRNYENNKNYSFKNRPQGRKNWHRVKGSQKYRHHYQHGDDRRFQKFVDTEYHDKSRENGNYYSGHGYDGGVFTWRRNKPANDLKISEHINFDDEQYETTEQDQISNNSNPVQRKGPESIEINPEHHKVINRETDGLKIDNKTDVAKCPVVNQTLAPSSLNQENSVKQEKQSSSSSSSSSESSSSDEESEHNIKAAVSVKSETTSIAKPPSSPQIILKQRTNSVNSSSAISSEKLKPLPDVSSSSSSSSYEESSPPTSTTKIKTKVISHILKEPEPKKQNVSSEDDVVCVGKLENKIVLEDESNSNTREERRTSKTRTVSKQKKSVQQASEKCMICDKNGHTSFQCQMICKNCSAPYHGYRTCPHPANLNTMLQLFIEFCMQQLQNFQVENQTNTNNVPKPKVDSSHFTSAANKSNKLKRKQSRTNGTNKKHKKTKKRKVSTSKKTKSKVHSSESNDDDDQDDSETETSSAGTDDHIADSSDESLVSSKKKRNMKNTNAAKAAIDLSNFSANPIGLPMVLNGFPHLTVPTTAIHNPSTSTNALNTLLLTQMFQNAIGSLKR